MFDAIWALTAKMTVLTTLGEPAIKSIKFDFRQHKITPDCFAQVRKAIDSGRIAVVVNPKLGVTGTYDSGSNCLELVDGTSTYMERKALIVHECLHAWFDLKLVKNMTVKTSEAAAHLAQCIYARKKVGEAVAVSSRLQGSNPAKDHVFDLAWTLAGKVINAGKSPSQVEAEELEKAVAACPSYQSEAKDICQWNGVPKA
ncbi:MAG: hypothetical protein GVY13_07515 [Alphaproteobacteria bacterium]|jgi:hypothetical protein|nr:hypothetical protein [Alphaproteobacteria bacterium]